MKKVRTIYGMQEKSSSTLDGFSTKKDEDIQCWVDEEGNLYGATFWHWMSADVSTDIHEDGSVTITGTNAADDGLHRLLEKQTGKTLSPVAVSGVFPYLTIEGYGWDWKNMPEKHWVHDDVLRAHANRYNFKVLPLVIPKKYANKMEVNKVNEEEMKETMRTELKEWSVA